MKSMGMSLMCAKVEVTDWVTKSSGKVMREFHCIQTLEANTVTNRYSVLDC